MYERFGTDCGCLCVVSLGKEIATETKGQYNYAKTPLNIFLTRYIWILIQLFLFCEILFPDEFRRVLVALVTAVSTCVDSQGSPVYTGIRAVHFQIIQ